MSKLLKLTLVVLALGLCSMTAKAQVFSATADCVIGTNCGSAAATVYPAGEPHFPTSVAYAFCAAGENGCDTVGGEAQAVGWLFPNDYFQSGFNGLVTMTDSDGISDQFLQFGGNFPGTVFGCAGCYSEFSGGALIYDEGASWTLAQVTSDPNAFNFTCSEDGSDPTVPLCSAFGTGSAPFVDGNADNAMTGINWHIVGASDNEVGFDPYGLGHDNSDVVGASAVPEPSGLMLLGSGLMGLFGYAKMRLKK